MPRISFLRAPNPSGRASLKPGNCSVTTSSRVSFDLSGSHTAGVLYSHERNTTDIIVPPRERAIGLTRSTISWDDGSAYALTLVPEIAVGSVAVAVAMSVAVVPVRRLACHQINEVAQRDVGIHEVESPGGVRCRVNHR